MDTADAHFLQGKGLRMHNGYMSNNSYTDPASPFNNRYA